MQPAQQTAEIIMNAMDKYTTMTILKKCLFLLPSVAMDVEILRNSYVRQERGKAHKRGSRVSFEAF